MIEKYVLCVIFDNVCHCFYQYSTHVMKNVEANCGYEIPLQSEVTIENETYTMYDPSPQYHACRNPEYSVAINREDGVFIR